MRHFVAYMEEIEAAFDGRPVLIDGEYHVDGTMSRGFRGTWWEPPEPSMFEPDRERVEATRVTFTDTGDEVVPDADLLAHSLAILQAYADVHAEQWHREFEREILDDEDCLWDRRFAHA